MSQRRWTVRIDGYPPRTLRAMSAEQACRVTTPLFTDCTPVKGRDSGSFLLRRGIRSHRVEVAPARWETGDVLKRHDGALVVIVEDAGKKGYHWTYAGPYAEGPWLSSNGTDPELAGEYAPYDLIGMGYTAFAAAVMGL